MLGTNEPSQEIMALVVLRKLILQTRMRSHPMGLDVWFLVGPFVYFHTSCFRTAKALARLRGCAGSPEPSLVAYVISTIISWAGSNGLRNRSVLVVNCWRSVVMQSLSRTRSQDGCQIGCHNLRISHKGTTRYTRISVSCLGVSEWNELAYF